MMKCSLYILVVLPFCAHSQLLDNTKGLAFTDAPFFNTFFVKASKIKSIKGEYTFKKQGDIMRESNYVYVFSFDTTGNLIQHYQTAKGDIITDTTVRLYDYSEKGWLLRSRISQKRGFLSTYYIHDQEGKVIKEEVYRDIDTTHSILDPIIERSLLWNTETMQYEDYEGQFRKKVFNSYGNQYLEITRYYDSIGFLNRVEELYTITRNKITTKYSYSDKGLIERMVTTRNLDSIPISENFFTYDAFGNLQSKKEYKNGVYTTEYQVIYSGLTGLLSSILIREVSSNFISIIRFEEPEFWDKPKQN